MSVNEFLRDLNAEKKGSGEKLTEKEKGGRGLGGLNKLIAVMFDADRTPLSVDPFEKELMERNGITCPIGSFRNIHSRQQDPSDTHGRSTIIYSRLDWS